MFFLGITLYVIFCAAEERKKVAKFFSKSHSSGNPVVSMSCDLGRERERGNVATDNSPVKIP